MLETQMLRALHGAKLLWELQRDMRGRDASVQEVGVGRDLYSVVTQKGQTLLQEIMS